VLSSYERRVLDEVERLYALETCEPPRRNARQGREWASLDRQVTVGVLAAAWSSLVLAMFGAVVTATVLASATSLTWLVWCLCARPGPDDGEPPSQ
jgi:hypothetical protein